MGHGVSAFQTGWPGWGWGWTTGGTPLALTREAGSHGAPSNAGRPVGWPRGEVWMMRYLLAVGLAFGAVSLIDMAAPAQAAAATYYVDGSCSANGNGTGDGCASAAGG